MNTKILHIAGILGGAVVGAAVGYFVAQERLVKKFDALLEEEVEKTREHLAAQYKRDEFATPEAVLARRKPARPEGVSDEVHVGPDTEVVEHVLTKLRHGTWNGDKPAVKNIFENPAKDAPLKIDKSGPYIISVDEFMAGEKSYSQINYTYFEGDGVLCDEADMPVQDTNRSVGDDNLTHFGAMSNDPNVVYIRNDKQQLDYEICRSGGSYSEEVAGMQEDPFRGPKILKMRKE